MAQIEPTAAVVCDAGPLIHLHEVDCLDLLADFRAVWVPDAVWVEVLRHRPGALEGGQVELLRESPDIPPEADLRTITQVFALDWGEQQALALMRIRPEAVLLTDDAAARMAAKALGYRAQGTHGVLLRAIRRAQRSREQVLATLRALPRLSTLHLRKDLLQTVIEEVERMPD